MLKVTRRLLKLVAFLNIALGLLILAIWLWLLVDPASFLGAVGGGAKAEITLTGARLSLGLMAPVMIAAHIIFARLLLILDSVDQGDPFVPDNGDRLQTVAWALLAVQICDLLFGAIGVWTDVLAGERISGWSPALTGWIAVLLVFVLARVFREGARLRDDAELTI